MSDSWTRTEKPPTDKERAAQKQMGIARKQEEGDEKDILIRKMMPYEEA